LWATASTFTQVEVLAMLTNTDELGLKNRVFIYFYGAILVFAHKPMQ